MHKEKITSLPYNKYAKPRINTIKKRVISSNMSIVCGSNMDFEINTDKCTKGNTWSGHFKKEPHR